MLSLYRYILGWNTVIIISIGLLDSAIFQSCHFLEECQFLDMSRNSDSQFRTRSHVIVTSSYIHQLVLYYSVFYLNCAHLILCKISFYFKRYYMIYVCLPHVADTKNSSGIVPNSITETALNAVSLQWKPKEQAAKVTIKLKDVIV